MTFVVETKFFPSHILLYLYRCNVQAILIKPRNIFFLLKFLILYNGILIVISFNIICVKYVQEYI